MLKTLSLVLPVLLPSWRFFQTIEPSPRVQWTLLSKDGVADWREFRPRPATITVLQMLTRLIWNGARNDALFVVSCAERITESPTAHSISEIQRRILSDLTHDDLTHGSSVSDAHAAQFRLVFISREGTGMRQETLFQSDPFPVAGAAA
ncbi:hypothetical protein SAMN04488040_0856 [Sulfitobacter marinus]|uniref:Uncharacterized protein n=1 Tax=Sulfitobacter marinus TaxID=394264 RepID=A0A1I6QQI9_9RHOB|nr:hypothetical protein [Sulfitobacter marinus]SFS54639.1 hypothetical protein SAMN04488040_0856 [Sulfitobacter marinus]